MLNFEQPGLSGDHKLASILRLASILAEKAGYALPGEHGLWQSPEDAAELQEQVRQTDAEIAVILDFCTKALNRMDRALAST